MREEKTIQISLQLPVSELQALTALAQQLRALMEQGREAVPLADAPETNPSFDDARFQELKTSGRAKELSVVSEAEAVIGRTETDIPAPPAEGETIFSEAELPPTRPDILWQSLLSAAEIPSAEAALQSAASDISGDDKQYAQDPAPLAADSRHATFTAVTSGDTAAARAARSAGAESPATATPSTLTAEAVSQAFRRDDRRYDNGFPLY